MTSFVDRVVLHVAAGDGGNGCTSVMREKFRPLGGPDGGNGGRGGDIILVADPQVTTLLEYHHSPHRKATSGKPGQGGNKDGASGQDTTLRVPPGTVVSNADGDERADWNREQASWLRALRDHGFVSSASEPDVQEVVEGLHRYLAATPSKVVALSLPDIVGDIRTQNQPGTDQEYPNWRVPTCDANGFAVTIEDLTERADLSDRADRLIGTVARRAHR